MPSSTIIFSRFCKRSRQRLITSEPRVVAARLWPRCSRRNSILTTVSCAAGSIRTRQLTGRPCPVFDSPRTISLPSSVCLDFRLSARSVGQPAPFFASLACQHDRLGHSQNSSRCAAKWKFPAQPRGHVHQLPTIIRAEHIGLDFRHREQR